MRLADIEPLIENGWVLERHGVANCHLATMSLADIPTIDPESLIPKGRWVDGYIDTGDGPEPEDAFKCNRCGKWQWRRSNYCHNCGAKMEG